MTQLSDAEYAATMAQVGLINTMVAGLDPDVLDAMVQTIDTASAVGPLLDPSAFLGGAKFEELRAQRELLQAVAAHRRLVMDLAEQFNVPLPGA